MNKPTTLFVCSCENTMPLDTNAIARACKSVTVESGQQLCRAELDGVGLALKSGEPVTIACTQETLIFSETAGDTPVSFVNIRENAGWSRDAKQSGPKIAALLAAAQTAMPESPFVSLKSEGVALVYGIDERAIEAAALLNDKLDVTVLLHKPSAIEPPRSTDFPVVKGTIRNAKGYLGAFEVIVDDYAQASPSSRGAMVFGAPRNNAVSRCDILIDLSGGAALFPAHDLRDGYLRADPNDPAAILRLVIKASDLVGDFDKPRYIAFAEDLCAHSRSRIVGCHRCLDLCPTGAISPNGDHVAIDPYICAGCGACASACPTGAASYALPPVDALIQKLRTLLATYSEAGGVRPVILFHDDTHGAPLIHALARHGDGLPANVLPVAVNELTQLGLETIAAAFAYGAGAIRLLLRGKERHDVTGLRTMVALAEPILTGLGLGQNRVATIETDDPFALGEALWSAEWPAGIAKPAGFQPVGAKRDLMRLALRELHHVAPTPIDVIPLPDSAPFGRIEVDVAGCTLCLACVSACPTGALSDNPDRPTLKFTEDACVQCGLCKATCPEKVISLVPQIDFRAATAQPKIIKEEEPFHCIRCDKPFGTKSTIERITAKLEGRHWMFKGQAKRLDVLKMCEDCRVIAMTEESFDPYGAQNRPHPKTTADYLREREEKGEV